VEECLRCSERSCQGPISIAVVCKDTHDLTTD
jgi:hypothetical protein